MMVEAPIPGRNLTIHLARTLGFVQRPSLFIPSDEIPKGGKAGLWR
ncbi:hypothetical protein [Methylocella sp. CPCC 101449]|nr:hypothetical protein [Methylocella sp. CPCC 101449]MDT2019975.1 hypothetical protein [Methylocella sp. CPCC 101449]